MTAAQEGILFTPFSYDEKDIECCLKASYERVFLCIIR